LQLEWLCFHDDSQTKWDHLEFVITTDDLQLVPYENNTLRAFFETNVWNELVTLTLNH
jgi:hypothetical protein